MPKTSAEKLKYIRDWKRENPERVKASKDKRRAEIAAKQRAYARANPDVVLNGKLMRAYGISLETYRLMVAAQGGCCACCGEPPAGKRRLFVDHDHVTGRVRALLCHHCNAGIGCFREDPARLKLAIEYILKHRAP